MSMRCAITRRQLVSGLGLAFAASAVPSARAQDAQAKDAQTQDLAAGGGFRLLRARPARVALRGPGQAPTGLWAYEGRVPGPALRLRRGDDLRVRLVNALGEPTAVRWRGLRGANALVGAPPALAMAAADARADYGFSCPDAGTFWYHAANHAQSGRGLHGVVVVEDTEPVAVDRDVALMLAEWRLTPDGAIEPGEGAAQRLVTANGAPPAAIAVRTHERLRLRLVNAAAGVMTVRVDRHRVLVMALDGQPAEPFAARDGRVFLGPGNRADLFVDMTLAADASADIVAATEAGEWPVARLAYAAGGPARAAPLPAPQPLPANPLPERMDLAGALKIDLAVGGEPPADGASMQTLPARPAFAVKRGRTVTLGLPNRSERAQVVHLDGHCFRLLDRLDDGWKPFWLDTLVVPAGQTARIAFLADNPGAWMIDAREVGSGRATMATWFAIA